MSDCTKCIIDGTDACPKGAGRAVDDEVCNDFITENVYDDMASAVGLFIAQCCEMAEQNWCPSQIEMLHRLFGAVLKGCEYADYEIGVEDEEDN